MTSKTPTFEEVWAETGYQYGPDALENVQLGWHLALTALTPAPSEVREKAVEAIRNAFVPYLPDGDWSGHIASVANAILSSLPGEAKAQEPELKADFLKSLPGGSLDDSTFQAVEDALDKADAEMRLEHGRWLTLPERVSALAADRDLLREVLRDILAKAEECAVFDQENLDALKKGLAEGASPPPFSAQQYWQHRAKLARQMADWISGHVRTPGPGPVQPNGT